MSNITRFFNDISVTTAGLEIQDIIKGSARIYNGSLEQIIIEMTSGSATTLEVQLRYEEGNDDRVKLIYLYEDGTLPTFVDSQIGAPFSFIRQSSGKDLYLYLLPDANCVVNIRIDLSLD